MKTSEEPDALRPGVILACEDESCSLLPAMRRFVETGNPEEWTPIEPDVTLRMAMAQDDGKMACLLVEIDQFQ